MKNLTLIMAATAILATSPHSSNAQHTGEGENGVTCRKVSFYNQVGINVIGNIHYPAHFDETKTYAAVITVPPAGGVKEQTAGLYARKLAESGFITLAIDPSFLGESGGEPRYREDPTVRIEDIRGAIDHLTTLPYIDENRIGVLGICAGGGYAVSAAMTERRIRAVATTVPVNAGRENRAGGSQATIATLEMIAAQRTAEARGAQPMIVPWMPDEYKDAADIDLRQGYDYYCTPRGAHPNWANKMRFISMDAVMAFDAFYLVETLLTQPLQIIAGSQQGSFGSNNDGHELFQRAASPQKDLLVMEGASHFDLYDNPAYINPAIQKLTDFYRTHLARP